MTAEELNQIPEWQCIKKVRAFKIGEVIQYPTLDLEPPVVSYGIVPAETGIPTVTVSQPYILRHSPQPGGYYVIYDDGAYASFSPAEPFEKGYIPMLKVIDGGEVVTFKQILEEPRFLKGDALQTFFAVQGEASTDIYPCVLMFEGEERDKVFAHKIDFAGPVEQKPRPETRFRIFPEVFRVVTLTDQKLVVN